MVRDGPGSPATAESNGARRSPPSPLLPILSKLLFRLFGRWSLLLFSDPMTLDRWLWIRRHLPDAPCRVLDAGSGNGWLCVNAAQLGHSCLGLSGDAREVLKATSRARYLRAVRHTPEFQQQDLRELSSRRDLEARFDVVVCAETLEHIIDDGSVMRALASCLAPSGTLIVTAPYLGYIPMGIGDRGPFLNVETGGHVRKGYSPDDLTKLCDESKLRVVTIGGCSGFFSQKLTALMRLGEVALHSRALSWLVSLPLRVIPPLLDPAVRIVGWPDYSICLVATKIPEP